ncbi:MAG TPA: hypothetical protein VGJ84_19405 [Polyangiaceae bacterium]
MATRSAARIPPERAERVARAHACPNCREYSFKKLTVKPPTASQRRHLKLAWSVLRTCGVCGLQEELGIDEEGEITDFV